MKPVAQNRNIKYSAKQGNINGMKIAEVILKLWKKWKK